MRKLKKNNLYIWATVFYIVVMLWRMTKTESKIEAFILGFIFGLVFLISISFKYVETKKANKKQGNE